MCGSYEILWPRHVLFSVHVATTKSISIVDLCHTYISAFETSENISNFTILHNLFPHTFLLSDILFTRRSTLPIHLTVDPARHLTLSHQCQASFKSSKVFFKDSNIILKYNILGDCFGLKRTCLYIGRWILNMKHKINTEMCKFWRILWSKKYFM